MAALTDNVARPDRGVSVMEFPVGAGVVIFAGSFCGLTVATGAIAPWSGSAMKPVGFAKTYADGDDTRGEPYTHVTIDTAAKIVEQLPVTGLAGDLTDVGAPVYAASDNDFDLDGTGKGAAIGIVVKHIDASIADVAIFGFLEQMLEA